MHLILIPVNEHELRELIHLTFRDDKDLAENYHIIAPASAAEISSHTFDTIISNMQTVQGDFFKVALVCGNDIEIIGFTVLVSSIADPKMLYSFGIIPKYRLKPILLSWLSAVESILGFPFAVGLYQKNIRAIEFFRKNSFKEDESTDEYIILLSGKSLKIWQ